MNKKILLIILALFLTVNCSFADDSKPNNENKQQTSGLDKNTIYYPNANIKSAVSKYKKGNYTGCLQELFSLTKKDPSNAMAYYYMGMVYAHLNMQNEAVEAYEKAIALNPNSYIANYAQKGKDCLTGGPTCASANAENQDALDKFINSPYGNGLSDELNTETKRKELTNIRDTINRKESLDYRDIKKIRDFDNKSESDKSEKIAMVSDDEVLNAINTLKEAGVNVTIQTENPYFMQDPQMAEMSMLLGNYNNNNYNNMMMPMLMYQNGKNIDPKLMQAMMMNSMMTDFNFNNNDNNRY